jgi:hypothetical protein
MTRALEVTQPCGTFIAFALPFKTSQTMGVPEEGVAG